MIEHASGNYAIQRGGATYSCGVRALQGYEIHHITLTRPLPLAAALEAIATHLASSGRPPQALCGLELRCPAPYSFEGFAAFNEQYCQLLRKHHMLSDAQDLNHQNPIARTNVFPLAESLTEQTVYAFSYTRPITGTSAQPSFVISGAGELRESALDKAAIVRRGETSADAMEEKAACVMDIMESRLNALGVHWSDVTAANIYTAHDITPFLKTVILDRMGSAGRLGVHWHLSRPPVASIEFEMDMRGVRRESYEALL